jgi:hypothetical protein
LHDAENVFESLNLHDQKLTLNDLVEICMQSAHEEAEGPQPKGRTITVAQVIDGLGLIDAGI